MQYTVIYTITITGPSTSILLEVAVTLTTSLVTTALSGLPLAGPITAVSVQVYESSTSSST